MAGYDRNTSKYRRWRQAVLFRDGYKCTRCGAETNLEVHHIYPVKLFPEMAIDIENGITLCKKCHYEEDGRFYSEKVARSCSSLVDDLHIFFRKLRTATYYISYRKNIICNFWKALPMPRKFRRYVERLGSEIALIIIIAIVLMLAHLIVR